MTPDPLTDAEKALKQAETDRLRALGRPNVETLKARAQAKRDRRAQSRRERA